LEPFEPGYLSTGNEKRLKFAIKRGYGYDSAVKFIPGSNHLLVAYEGQAFVIDVRGMNVLSSTKLGLGTGSISISPQGNSFAFTGKGTNGETSVTLVRITESGKMLTTEVPGNYFDRNEFERSGRLIVENSHFEHRRFCLPSLITAHPPESDSSMNELSPKEKELCSKNLNDKAWTVATPDPVPQQLDRKQTRAYLTRFQKPGGFESLKHLGLLTSILRSPLADEESNLVAGTLQNIFAENRALYGVLLTEFPKLLEKNPNAYWKNPCRTEPENKNLVEAAKKEVEKNFERNSWGSDYSRWKSLIPLAPLLSQAPETEKENTVEKIMISMRDRAIDTDNFRGVFPSKLAHAAGDSIKPIFGLPSENFNDIALLRTSNALSPIILSGLPFQGGTKSDFGFYFKNLPSILRRNNYSGEIEERSDHMQAKVRWLHGQEVSEATIDLNRIPTDEMINREDRFRFKELWADGQLNGMVIVGSNYKSVAPVVIAEYLKYYQHEGFTFSQSPETISGFEKVLQEQIESGYLDYLPKEAHSEGDDQHALSFNDKMLCLTGTKTNPDGTSETVRLTYPLPDDYSDPKRITNEKFGDWITERVRRAKLNTSPQKWGQLAFLNTSCNSADKAINEIEAAHDRNLLNIASDSTTNPFLYWQGSALLNYVDGLRKGRTFQEIRNIIDTKVAKAPKPPKRAFFEGGHSGNDKEDIYLTPEQKAYDERIIKRLMPYRTSIKVTKIKPGSSIAQVTNGTENSNVNQRE
jgi:hypothetical protein